MTDMSAHHLSVSKVLGLAALASALLVNERASAAVLTVPIPTPTIQAAINAAVNGDEIIVAPGIYPEVIDFLGKAITVRSFGGATVTTIDGTGFNESVVKCVSGEGPTAILQGFTITGGLPIGGSGGGMRIVLSSPKVFDCVFEGNTAGAGAGGGGGVFNQNSQAAFFFCTFRANTGQGGGMFNDGSDVIVVGCDFIANTASDNGGGVCNVFSNPRLWNCTFVGNTNGDGAGMCNNQSNPEIVNCVFSGNSLSVGGNKQGGAMLNGASNPTIINSTFVRNSVSPGGTSRGGGIFNSAGSMPVVTNCIFWANSDGSGMGQTAQIHDFSGSTTVNHSLVQGGWTGLGAANINTDPLLVDELGPDLTPGTGDENLALQDVSPAIDAGDSSALPADAFDLDNDANTLEPLPIDLAGNQRAFEHLLVIDTGIPDALGRIVDMGAFEKLRVVCPQLFGDANLDGVVNFADVTSVLGHWLEVCP